jgi:hypothetical protein
VVQGAVRKEFLAIVRAEKKKNLLGKSETKLMRRERRFPIRMTLNIQGG